VGRGKMKYISIISLLVLLFSGCITSNPAVIGTYQNTYQEKWSPQVVIQQIILYPDSTWFYLNLNYTDDVNSGAYTIQDNNMIVLTATFGSEQFRIQENGSLIDTQGRLWSKINIH